MQEIVKGSVLRVYFKFLVEYLQREGGRDAFTHLNGDLSIKDDLLFVARQHEMPPNTPHFPPRDTFALPAPWDGMTKLTELYGDAVVEKAADGKFHNVKGGAYRMS